MTFRKGHEWKIANTLFRYPKCLGNRRKVPDAIGFIKITVEPRFIIHKCMLLVCMQLKKYQEKGQIARHFQAFRINISFNCGNYSIQLNCTCDSSIWAKAASAMGYHKLLINQPWKSKIPHIENYSTVYGNMSQNCFLHAPSVSFKGRYNSPIVLLLRPLIKQVD